MKYIFLIGMILAGVMVCVDKDKSLMWLILASLDYLIFLNLKKQK